MSGRITRAPALLHFGWRRGSCPRSPAGSWWSRPAACLPCTIIGLEKLVRASAQANPAKVAADGGVASAEERRWATEYYLIKMVSVVPALRQCGDQNVEPNSTRPTQRCTTSDTTTWEQPAAAGVEKNEQPVTDAHFPGQATRQPRKKKSPFSTPNEQNRRPGNAGGKRNSSAGGGRLPGQNAQK